MKYGLTSCLAEKEQTRAEEENKKNKVGCHNTIRFFRVMWHLKNELEIDIH